MTDRRSDLDQYFTKRWAARVLFDRHFGDVTASDLVLDPCTGSGSWLFAVPDTTYAIGIEIDPELARQAARDTGRDVICGDFTNIALSIEPSIIVGNIPFRAARAFIRRTCDLLTAGGRAGFILPVPLLSFARPTIDLLRGFEVKADLIPRDLFPRIHVPLLFALLRKATTHRLLGFALYEEAASVRTMRIQYRRALEQSRHVGWREVLDMALIALGGEGSIDAICSIIQPEFRPTDKPWFRDYIRRDLGAYHERIRPGYFRRRAA